MFGLKKFWVKKESLGSTNSKSKIFWFHKYFEPKKNFGPKNVESKRILLQNDFGSNKFWVQKILGFVSKFGKNQTSIS